MKNQPKRAYNSIVRQKQAEETKNRIADAAEELIKSQGYESTTIGAIAQNAGVATQTVYAIFNSKQGILMHILRRSLKTVKMEMDFSTILNASSLGKVAKHVADFTTKYGQEQISILNSLGGFELIYPELHNLMSEASQSRRASIEEAVNSGLAARNITLTGLKKKMIVDLLWAFTDNHLYYSLVVDAGWPLERFTKAFEKIMESLLAEIAPEVLRSVEE